MVNGCNTMPAIATAAGRRPAEAVLRQCLALRQRLAHFTTSLQYYIHFEVLEASWEGFSRRAQSARNLDQLIAAHEEYQVPGRNAE